MTIEIHVRVRYKITCPCVKLTGTLAQIVLFILVLLSCVSSRMRGYISQLTFPVSTCDSLLVILIVRKNLMIDKV